VAAERPRWRQHSPNLLNESKVAVLWLRVGSNSAEQVYHALTRPLGEEQAMAMAFLRG